MKENKDIKRILILGTGGSPGHNVVQSLRSAPEKFWIVGAEVDPYSIHRSEADITYLTPRSSDPLSFVRLEEIIRKEKIEFIHAQPENEIGNISRHRDKLDEFGVRHFLPSHKTILKCRDKFESYKTWEKEGLIVPKTMLVRDETDLKRAFDNLRRDSKMIWLRKIKGGGGIGAIPTDSFNLAKIWIDLWHGWGEFTAAECLSPNSVTWSSIWKKGELIVAQSRARIYWEFSNKILSGITGVTGAAKTVSEPILDKIAYKTIKAIDNCPHGVFSVDLTYDNQGVANPTEINIGRFFTTINFFTQAGLNMPYIMVKLAYKEPLPKISRKINPLESDWCWIRGMDLSPKLLKISEVKQVENDLLNGLYRYKTRGE